MVKNNTDKTISTKNIANQLSTSLYNDRGLDISIPNEALNDAKINRRAEDRKWRFRSNSTVIGKVYVNGKEDKGEPKMQEDIEIPARGEWKVNLTIQYVKQVETAQDVQNRLLKPTVKLAPGNYKLILHLLIIPTQKNKQGEYGGIYASPMIDIEYGR